MTARGLLGWETRRVVWENRFKVNSAGAWPPQRIAGVEGLRLACRLQVE